jgi:hypothetical protein
MPSVVLVVGLVEDKRSIQGRQDRKERAPDIPFDPDSAQKSGVCAVGIAAFEPCYARNPSSCVTSCSLSWIAFNLHRNILITRRWSCSCHLTARRPRSRSNSLSAAAIRRSQSAMDVKIDPSLTDIATALP